MYSKFSYSHILIFSYSHILIFSYSHILIFPYSQLLHVHQLDVEDDRCIAWNGTVSVTAIGEPRRDDQRAMAADSHAHDALMPTRNHVPAAKNEIECGAAVARGVEAVAV